MRTLMPGHFNVANALGAFAAAIALEVDPDEAAAGLARARRVPGRFEPVDEGQGFAVLVDYAHTPDSLDNVLGAARRLTAGRVIAVFGAGGDRDRDKRPKMGRAGAGGSDLAIVTSDNPRSEDPEAIIAEVLAGAGAGSEVEAEPDRRAAIALAFERAEPGDTVVIAGKGHEQGQEFEDGRKVPFDDREVAREELGRLGGAEMNLDPQRIGAALGAEIVAEGGPGSPARATIDSGATGEGDLFFGLRGERVDGGEFAPAAIEAGAWGVVVGPASRRILPDQGDDRDLAGRAGFLRSRTRWRRCSRWPLPGGGSWVRGSSASPARWARPRSRTSPGRCSPAGSTPTARTSTPRSGCR